MKISYLMCAPDNIMNSVLNDEDRLRIMDLAEGQILKKLECFIYNYNRVIIIKKSKDTQILIPKLVKKIREDNRNVLIVTNDICDEGSCLETVTDSEIELYCRVYSMYEFSDRIMVIDDSRLHPVLFNYLLTDLLTEDEILGLLLR